MSRSSPEFFEYHMLEDMNEVFHYDGPADSQPEQKAHEAAAAAADEGATLPNAYQSTLIYHAPYERACTLPDCSICATEAKRQSDAYELYKQRLRELDVAAANYYDLKEECIYQLVCELRGIDYAVDLALVDAEPSHN